MQAKHIPHYSHTHDAARHSPSAMILLQMFSEHRLGRYHAKLKARSAALKPVSMHSTTLQKHQSLQENIHSWVMATNAGGMINAILIYIQFSSLLVLTLASQLLLFPSLLGFLNSDVLKKQQHAVMQYLTVMLFYATVGMLWHSVQHKLRALRYLLSFAGATLAGQQEISIMLQ